MKIFQIGGNKDTLHCLHETTILVSRPVTVSYEQLHKFLADPAYDVAVFDASSSHILENIVRRLRTQQHLLIPIIGLTSEIAEHSWSEQRASFLEAGGDDLFRAPINKREFIATLQAVARRAQGSASNVRNFLIDDVEISINFDTNVVKVQGREIFLTAIEFLVLEAMTKRPGFWKTRDALMEAAYPDGRFVEDRAVDSHVKRIRKSLRAKHPSAGDLIFTGYGKGYQVPSSYCA